MLEPDSTPTTAPIEPQWLPLPTVAERLGVELRDVRGMLADYRLLSVRRLTGSVRTVPSTFLTDAPDGQAQILPGLRGTLVHLSDAGLDAEEIITWLHQHNDQLGRAPVALLRSGAIRPVRHAAQMQVW